MRAAENQARLYICAVSPGPLQIALKRRDVDEGSVKFYRPVQENLILVTYASSGESGKTVHLRRITRAFANRIKKKEKKECR